MCHAASARLQRIDRFRRCSAGHKVYARRTAASCAAARSTCCWTLDCAAHEIAICSSNREARAEETVRSFMPAECAASRLATIRPAHELVEPALFATGSPVLVQKCQLVLVENFEPILPLHRFERALAAGAGKIDAQDTFLILALPAGAFNDRRLAIPRLDPFADFVVIDRDIGGAAGPAASARSRSTARTGSRARSAYAMRSVR